MVPGAGQYRVPWPGGDPAYAGWFPVHAPASDPAKYAVVQVRGSGPVPCDEGWCRARVAVPGADGPGGLGVPGGVRVQGGAVR